MRDWMETRAGEEEEEEWNTKNSARNAMICEALFFPSEAKEGEVNPVWKRILIS